MVRATALAMLLFVLLSVCLPFFQPSLESSLPACCRRDGKHHCAMMAAVRSPSQDQTTVRGAADLCPYRSILFRPAAPHALGVPARSAYCAQPISYPAAILQTVLQARISEARSHHKRGPPLFLA